MKALITGSGGLIGSECARVLCREGWEVVGIDNDMRAQFFGPEGTTRPVVEELLATLPHYRHYALDIRDRQGVCDLLQQARPDCIIHTAAQPSHDKAAAIPYDDFDVNAVGTLNMLVAARDFCRDTPFCFTSTNKVYGDRPNSLPLVELDTRYDYANGLDGISEAMAIDQCLHSLFGASKVAADVLCQEFGRYFQMPIGIFRGGASRAIWVSHCTKEAGASQPLRSIALWSRLNLLTADYGETSLRTRYLRIRFADLCHQPAPVIAQIFAFCGLAGAVEPIARCEVRPPASLGRWRTQARDTLAALHRVGQVTLERFGYNSTRE